MNGNKTKEREELKNLIKFIFEHHTRLSCILRFNNTPRITPENVAEHSYYVAFLGMLIGDYLENKGVEIDKLRLIQMALFHDVEETVSGDILAPIKQGAFRKILDKENIRNIAMLTGGLENGKKYSRLWQEVVDEKTLEAKIIKLVDKMSCIIYCIREIHLGNRYFRAILECEATNILKYSKRIPFATEFVTEAVNYTLSYLSGDKEIYDAINKAVRVYDYAGKY